MQEPVPDAPTLSWSTGRTKTTANWSPIHDRSWSSFVRWLKPEQPAASKEVRPYVGGTLKHGRRSIRTVEQRFFLTLDADYADVDFPFDVADVLADMPYLIHTTWRHTAEAHRYRLIIPLSRGTEANEYKELAWTVMNRLDGKRFDVTTAQAERFMWSPSSADEATYFWTAPNGQGAYLPVDEWLDGHHGPSEAPAAAGQGNPPPTPPATGSEALSASAEDIERAEEILASAVDAVLHVHERGEFAGRNEAVFHLMPTLIRFADAGALDEDLVLDSLFNAAQAVPADEAYTRQEFNASVRSAREYADEAGPMLPETTPSKMAAADFADVDFAADPDLWGKTPVLKHIAQAADSIGRNRLAMLAVTIARVLHEVDPSVCLPGVADGGIGARAALNIGVALVGGSGQGKTTFADRSRELVGTTDQDLTPSTGQGLIQTYLRWDPDAGENRLKDDPRALFYVDEIDTLGALSKDSGSTLLSEMRTMLTGGSTGSSNATRDRQRILPARSYSFQLVAGVQPSRAGTLLDGRDAGTPQRFIWAQVTDPKNAIPPKDRPKWPGPLGWNRDFLDILMMVDPIVRYPDWLLEELQEYDYKISMEGANGGELSQHGHHNLLRLKVAAGIAFLHESPAIQDEHLEITDMILAASRQVQKMCEREVAEEAHKRKKQQKLSEERVSEDVAEERVKKLVKNARGALLRADGEWVTWQTLRPAHRDREAYEEPVWEALVNMDDVETDETPFGGGVRRKAKMLDE